MSTIKSSSEHLTLNADGSSRDIKFQANGVEKASISSAGAFTSTTIDATKLTGNLPAISGASLTGLVAGTGAFAARYDSDVWAAIADNTILAFNNKGTGNSFDTDGNYNTSTYKYTAPATGVYLFWMSIYTAQADVANGFTFLKNASQITLTHSGSNMFIYGGNADDKILNGTVVLPLASGDTMAVQTATASDVHLGTSKWGGCRLA